MEEDGEGERGGGAGQMGRCKWKEGEIGRCGDREIGRWTRVGRGGVTGRWGDGEMLGGGSVVAGGTRRVRDR